MENPFSDEFNAALIYSDLSVETKNKRNRNVYRIDTTAHSSIEHWTSPTSHPASPLDQRAPAVETKTECNLHMLNKYHSAVDATVREGEKEGEANAFPSRDCAESVRCNIFGPRQQFVHLIALKMRIPIYGIELWQRDRLSWAELISMNRACTVLGTYFHSTETLLPSYWFRILIR